ncbi:MAG TPA: hypothetical protein VK727_20400 [Steroidobacteraceae bacterium]|nr:hypothetical protein [Steroidobacteraceae bacterium]
MEITLRDAVTVVHGMFFGALLLLAFTGAGMGLYAVSAPVGRWNVTPAQQRWLSLYIALMALLAWLTVLLGAYAVYPWYRAHPPAGLTDLSGYPQRLLMSSPGTAQWHDLGMEWKEHIAWFAPMSLTAAAYLVARYGAHLHVLRPVRRALIGLLALAFLSAGVAGFFGAMLNKYAPVRGGPHIVLMHGDSHDE